MVWSFTQQRIIHMFVLCCVSLWLGSDRFNPEGLCHKHWGSTWCEIDPDAAYEACICVSNGFPYMVSIFPCFPNMVSIFPFFTYMVMLPKHLNAKVIVVDRALLWRLHGPKGRNCDITMIRPLLFHGIHTDLSGSPTMVFMGCQPIIYWISKQFVAYYHEMTPYV